MRRLVTTLLAAACAAGVGCAGSAPPASPPGSAAPTTSTAPRILVVDEPGSSAVALALVVPGSGWEPAGETGVTLLAARSVLADVEPELEAAGAVADVACGRWAFVVRLVAPRESWAEAAEVLVSALAAGRPSAAGVERARVGLKSALRLDEASPAWQARLAAARALHGNGGDGEAWARPGCGVAAALDLFDPAAVSDAASRLGSFAGAAIVGAADSAEVAAVSSRIRALRARSAVPLPLPPAPTTGRVYAERNTVTAWLTVSWPFGPEADADAVRVVGSLLSEAVAPAVTRPWVLHASSDVEVHGRGGSLVVTVVTAPGEAARVALSLEDAVDRLVAGLEPAASLERAGRASWGARLVELETPEARAARAAVDLVRGGSGSAWPRRESFGPAAVRQAAAALGMPARAVVGPRPARGAAVP